MEKLCLPRFVLIILGELCRDTINSFIRNKVEVERGVISKFQGFKRFGNFFFFMFVSCLIATGLIIMEVL